MSTAAAAADAAPAPAKGKKKLLIIIIAAVVLLAAAGGGAAFFLMKKKPVDGEEDDESGQAAPAKTAVKHDPKNPPVFVPLDPFTVNLADREAERYAQVGITLEISDAKLGDQIKTLMPAIRHRILMALADKTAAQLADRDGKTKLANEVARETSRVLGAEVPDDAAEAKADDDEDAPAKGKKKPKPKKKKAAPELPVRAVHFSNFIIQ